MQYEDSVKKLEQAIIPLVNHRDLALVDISLKGTPGNLILKISLDKVGGGITLADLENFSGELSYYLDMEELIPGSYTLEVASPGLERVLKTERELQWARGKRVKIITQRGEYYGIFRNYSKSQVELDEQGKHVIINRRDIVKLQLKET